MIDWIKVSDQMPDEKTPVLCCNSENFCPYSEHMDYSDDDLFVSDFKVHHCIGIFDGKKIKTYNHCCDYLGGGNVTHWMPLPKPPKGQRK